MDYFTNVLNGVEYIIAVGSILGLLGLLLGLLIWLVGNKEKAVKLIIFSLILIGICGLHTGTKYFRIWAILYRMSFNYRG